MRRMTLQNSLCNKNIQSVEKDEGILLQDKLPEEKPPLCHRSKPKFISVSFVKTKKKTKKTKTKNVEKVHRDLKSNAFFSILAPADFAAFERASARVAVAPAWWRGPRVSADPARKRCRTVWWACWWLPRIPVAGMTRAVSVFQFFGLKSRGATPHRARRPPPWCASV